MPQFFGSPINLDHESLELSKRFEPIEIRGVTEYLMAKSQPFEYATPAKWSRPSLRPSVAKWPSRSVAWRATSTTISRPARWTQGPDLSRIGAKLARNGNPDGPRWLYTWLRNPSQYHRCAR